MHNASAGSAFGWEEVLPCPPSHPKLQPGLWGAGLGAVRNSRRSQGGCAPVVCPSWKVAGVGMEHTDLLAPAWAGCLLICCQHSSFAAASPALCSALPCHGQWGFSQSQYLKKDLGGNLPAPHLTWTSVLPALPFL